MYLYVFDDKKKSNDACVIIKDFFCATRLKLWYGIMNRKIDIF